MKFTQYPAPNSDVCALFNPPVKVTSMSCVWNPTTSCSAGDLWCIGTYCAKTTRLRLTGMRIISEKSMLMLQQPEELAALGAAESAVTAEISSNRSMGTAHCGDYVYYRQMWQLRSVRHLSFVSHLASFSGANLPDLSGGSTLWFFHSEGVRFHQVSGTSPCMFSCTDVSAPAPSWLEGAHLCKLEMTFNHTIPFASINHWAKWKQDTGEGWVCDHVEVEQTFRKTGLALPETFKMVQFERLVDKPDKLESFPFLSPPLDPPAAPNPAGNSHPTPHLHCRASLCSHSGVAFITFLLTRCDTLVFSLEAPLNLKHGKCTVWRNVNCNSDTSPTFRFVGLLMIIQLIQLSRLLFHLHGKALDVRRYDCLPGLLVLKSALGHWEVLNRRH